MKYRVLGRTGLKVSVLGFGGHEYRRPLPTTLGKWGDIDLKEFKRKQSERNKLIEMAIDAGINYYDATQPEEAKSLGFALKELGLRNKVYVALMILRPLSKIAGKSRSDWKKIIIDDVEEKLELLQSDYTDILNVHMPEIEYSRERLTGTIKILCGLKNEGKIGSIAASSHEPRLLAEILRKFDCFDSVMVRYNYHLQEVKNIIFPLCKALNVGVSIMKPFSWPYYGIPFVRFEPLSKEKSRFTPIQTSLRWILKSPEVSTIVPGINTLSEFTENLEAIDKEGSINEDILKEYLEAAKSPTAKEALENMLNNSDIDIRYFAKRALKQFFSK
jgi:predicted aldo/keto reductase-like oxidoreductase